MNKLKKFSQFKVSSEKLLSIKGGTTVTVAEYCATNTMIMQSCYNSGDLACVAAAGAAWKANCTA